MITHTPYVYRITNTITGEFYIGSRYKNTKLKLTPEEDILIKYFSSSKRASSIKRHVGDYSAEILYRSVDHASVFWHEQGLIGEHITNPLCFNETFQNPSDGLSFCRSNVKMSQAHKDKIGKANAHKQEQVTCPHCGKIGGKSQMHNHHFDQCGIKKSKRVFETLQCPHCSKIGGANNMKRYHFDKCKLGVTIIPRMY